MTKQLDRPEVMKYNWVLFHPNEGGIGREVYASQEAIWGWTLLSKGRAIRKEKLDAEGATDISAENMARA